MPKKSVIQSTRGKAAPRKKVARAPRAKAAARLSVPVDAQLLAHARRHALGKGATLAAVVEEGLRKATGFSRAPVLPPGDAEAQDAAPAEGAAAWEQLLAWMEEQQVTLTEIRDALGDVAASLPSGAGPGPTRAPGTRIPPH